MPDLLLELRSEEIPARMQRKAAADLKKLVTDAMVDAGLTYEGAQEHFTPRRLALDIRGVSAGSADQREERKGPRTDAPEKAIAGFLRGAGLASVEQAEVRTDPKKGDFYVAVIEKPGRGAEEIIAEIVPPIIRAFPWPKSMRWGPASGARGRAYRQGETGMIEGRGSESLRWVRPLQSILCTFGPETEEPVVVPFEIDGIQSGDRTVGHRFHAGDDIVVKRFDDYADKLEKAHVVLSAERRKDMILHDAKDLTFASGLELVEDGALLEEVAGLVEWPVVLTGTFDEAFLEIPDEVIRLTIKTNQKCFVCRGTDGRLANRFVLVSNIAAKDGGAEIAAGNGRVVAARLSDALYFWQTDQRDLPDIGDLKTSADDLGLDLAKPLDQRMARLDHLDVTFHAKLGTQGERVRRIAALAEELAPIVGADPAKARRAALLAKADLQTEIVQEFPEVQGAMGKTYAALQGEDEAVATAIEDHYKPQGPNDAVPSEPVAIAVALADKLDTLTGFWAIDEKPTGSKDPFALRRAALGVIRIVAENGLQLRIRPFLKSWDTEYRPKTTDPVIGGPEGKWPLYWHYLIAFFHDRLKVYLRDQGMRHDLIDATLAAKKEQNDDLLLIIRRVQALSSLLGTEAGEALLAGTKRATNILAAEEKQGLSFDQPVDPSLFEQDEERALFEALEMQEKRAEDAIEAEDYDTALNALAQLRAPIDAFFEAVLVNAEIASVRANRLALLHRIRAATGRVADFSQISG